MSTSKPPLSTSPEQAPSTSYSDPIFNRLEPIVQWLGRNWLLVVTLVVVAITVAYVLLHQLRHNPQAEAWLAYQQATAAEGEALQQQSLEALAANTQTLSEVRLRAGLDLVTLHLRGTGPEAIAKARAAAAPLPQLAGDAITAGGSPALRMAVTCSIAAIDAQDGKLDDAVKGYRSAISDTVASTANEALGIQARLGLARCLIEQANSAATPDAALTLRKEAAETLDALIALRARAERSQGGRELMNTARWMYHNLLNKYPEAKPAPLGSPLTGPAPVAPAPAVVAPAPVAPAPAATAPVAAPTSAAPAAAAPVAAPTSAAPAAAAPVPSAAPAPTTPAAAPAPAPAAAPTQK